MQRLLRIDTSTRGDASHSRRLGDEIEQALREREPGLLVQRRNLADSPLPHLDLETIGAFFTPDEALTDGQRLGAALSDDIIDEVRGADTLLVTTPMFNFGVPSGLKAWIDQLVRIRRTFSYDGANFGGLLHGRTAIVAVAYGASGFAPGGAMATGDFVAPYLDYVLRFMGFDEVHVVRAEGMNTANPTWPSIERLMERLPQPPTEIRT
jgi:FMN-dependent NADH-azoreductase